jgi:hypothetical protein
VLVILDWNSQGLPEQIVDIGNFEYSANLLTQKHGLVENN